MAGDLSFYLSEYLLPLECLHPRGKEKFDCNNPEISDPNLVVTKVDIQVDNRYTSYSGCNLCNGTDPVTGELCKKGSYSCLCFGKFDPVPKACDPKRVGRTSMAQQVLALLDCMTLTDVYSNTSLAMRVPPLWIAGRSVHHFKHVIMTWSIDHPLTYVNCTVTAHHM